MPEINHHARANIRDRAAAVGYLGRQCSGDGDSALDGDAR